MTLRPVLLLGFAVVLGGCGGDSVRVVDDSDADSDTDTDTGGDSDADTDADTDADSDADTDADSDTDTGPGAPTCEDQYSDADGYVLCEETADECRFNAALNRTTNCGRVCGAQGGSCLGAEANGPDCGVEDPGEVGCDSQDYFSVICRCSRGCNGGPACEAGERCSDAGCVPAG